MRVTVGSIVINLDPLVPRFPWEQDTHDQINRDAADGTLHTGNTCSNNVNAVCLCMYVCMHAFVIIGTVAELWSVMKIEKSLNRLEENRDGAGFIGFFFRLPVQFTFDPYDFLC